MPKKEKVTQGLKRGRGRPRKINDKTLIDLLNKTKQKKTTLPNNNF